MLSHLSSCFLSASVSFTGCSRLANKVRVKMAECKPGLEVQRMAKAAQVEVELHDIEDIDLSKFIKRMQFQAVSVPKKMSQIAAKILSGYVLDMPRVKHIVADPADDDSRLIVLSDAVTSCLDGLPQEKLSALKKVVDLKVVSHEVVLDYTYWPVEHILKSILPDGWEVPSSFETIGHIAHLNLRDELLPYRKVIAKVILDKNRPKIKTVVNKVGTISNEFRVPSLEVLAGENSLITEVKQHRATFKLDYSLVYWNSRLENEHNRLASQFQDGQVVLDMFAGIGPFAIPAAQEGCTVFANDLNPDSVKYLKINVRINRVTSRVFPYNMDARQFMRKLMNSKDTKDEGFIQQSSSDFQNGNDPQDHRSEYRNMTESSSKSKVKDAEAVKPWEHFHHVIMNLPASAIQFLDVFQGLMSREYWRGPLPRVHCYCFMHSNDNMEDIVCQAETMLKGSICKPQCHVVRDVAPNKIMLCLSFQLPESVAFHETAMHKNDECNVERSNDECSLKRARVL